MHSDNVLCATEALTKTRMPDVVQSKQQQTNVDSLLLLTTLASEDHFFLLLLGASIPELIQFTFTWTKQEKMCLFLFISNTLLHMGAAQYDQTLIFWTTAQL